MIKVLNSNSKGNSVIYLDKILLDCGVPFKHIEPYIKDILIIVLTHQHKDHINTSVINKIQLKKPSVRVATPIWLVEELKRNNVRNIDVLEMNKTYNYGSFSLSPFVLYHDVLNCGYRIYDNVNNKKIFHATDTQHLIGITAKDYDLYAIECNYCEEKAQEKIEEARKTGAFCRVVNSIATHLSKQQAYEFYVANKKNGSQIVELHKSSEFY